MTTAVFSTGTPDAVRCASLLQAFGHDPDSMTILVIDGEPRSKARPRFSKSGHAYNAVKQVEHEQKLGWHMKRAFRDPMDGNLALACVFFRSSAARVDVDNMLKQVMDAANTICWRDDYQVTAIVGVVEMDRERPRTVIAVSRHVSTLVRVVLEDLHCRQCGKTYRPSNRTRSRRFCSTHCASLSRGEDLREPVPCGQCSAPFVRRHHRSRYCSNACRYAALHKGNRVTPLGAARDTHGLEGG